MAARWTEKELDKLISLRQSGASWGRISDRLKRSEDACRVKFYETKDKIHWNFSYPRVDKETAYHVDGMTKDEMKNMMAQTLKNLENVVQEQRANNVKPQIVSFQNVPLYALSICAAMLLLTWWLA